MIRGQGERAFEAAAATRFNVPITSTMQDTSSWLLRRA